MKQKLAIGMSDKLFLIFVEGAIQTFKFSLFLKMWKKEFQNNFTTLQVEWEIVKVRHQNIFNLNLNYVFINRNV